MPELVGHFGKAGKYYYEVCRGIDHREVSPSRIRKSISVERTFEENIFDHQEALKVLGELCHELGQILRKSDLSGRTLHLKWRYPDFITPTRSYSFQRFISDEALISSTVTQLFNENVEIANGIRLLGVGISNLDNQQHMPQLTLDI
jgi:DNA polymerase-4